MQGDLSSSELAIIELFASRIIRSKAASPVVKYRDLAALRPKAPIEIEIASESLAQRGWFCRGGHPMKSDDDPCILIAGGVDLARCISGMPGELP